MQWYMLQSDIDLLAAKVFKGGLARMSKGLLNEARGLKDWLIEVRRDFHRYPELGRREFRTQQRIIQYLRQMGIDNAKGMGNTGVVALIGQAKTDKIVALRADMDALPMEDYKDVSYKSTLEGKMHACGHDAHMAILLGAAKLLKKIEKQLQGGVKLIFQPDEENLGGAKPMIGAGVLEKPKVDAIFGLHVSTEIETGQIGIKYGQMKAASDTVKINIYGKSVHGAYPHGGVDAIVISGQVITALQTIISRNLDPRQGAVFTVGKIQGGGQANIIANKVEMTATVRTLDLKVRSYINKRIVEIVEGVAEALGGRGEVIRQEGYTCLVNHDDFVHIIEKNAIKLLGRKSIVKIPSPSFGVEDFGYFLEAVPGAYYNLGCKNVGKGKVHPGHSNYFDIDEECLPIGVALQVKNALETFKIL